MDDRFEVPALLYTVDLVVVQAESDKMNSVVITKLINRFILLL